jgi:hypothetical protein
MRRCVVARETRADADIDVLTARAFLEGIERRDNAHRPSAVTYWDRVVASEPMTNPRIQVFSQRRSK